VNRRTFALAGGAALLVGCKEPEGAGKSGNTNFVKAGTDIVIKTTRAYQITANTAQQGNTLYIVNFTFTNQYTVDFVPRLNHFVLEDELKIRHAALTSGNELLAGLNNDVSPMKLGEARDFTLGFQVFLNDAGIIFYDPS